MIRRAAVICPGASQQAYPGRQVGRYDVVIGVNRAVTWHVCDYWSCADVHTFSLAWPIGSPTIVCLRGIYREMCLRHPDAAEHEHLNRRAIRLDGTKLNWTRFSAHVAIVLAAQLGAVEIDCYGMDLAGTADADGFADPRQHRDEGRWNKERRILAELTEILAARGVTVKRCGVAETKGAA